MAESDTISCEEALRRLAEFVDGELTASRRDETRRHLEICKSCYSRMEFERRLREQLSGLSSRKVPAAAADRVRALIKAFK